MSISTVEVFQSAVVIVPVDLRQVSFITLVRNKKKKKTEHVEFYGIVKPFKSQAYSKNGSPIFLFFAS